MALPAAADFHGCTLRRGDFSGRDFRGADFAGSDLRGTDFSFAQLQGASFRGARMGLPPLWHALVMALGIGSALLLGVGAGVAAERLATGLQSANLRDPELIGALILGTGAWGVLVTRRAPQQALRSLWPLVLVFLAWGAFLAATHALGPARSASAIAAFSLLLATVTGTGILSRALAGTRARWALVALGLGSAAATTLVAANAVALLLALGSLWFGHRVIQRHPGVPAIASALESWVARHGTRFRESRLERASFVEVHAQACDFSGAHLDGSSWSHASVQGCYFANGETPHPVTLWDEPPLPTLPGALIEKSRAANAGGGSYSASHSG